MRAQVRLLGFIPYDVIADQGGKPGQSEMLIKYLNSQNIR